MAARWARSPPPPRPWRPMPTGAGSEDLRLVARRRGRDGGGAARAKPGASHFPYGSFDETAQHDGAGGLGEGVGGPSGRLATSHRVPTPLSRSTCRRRPPARSALAARPHARPRRLAADRRRMRWRPAGAMDVGARPLPSPRNDERAARAAAPAPRAAGRRPWRAPTRRRGRGGIADIKREGDGVTPAGRSALETSTTGPPRAAPSWAFARPARRHAADWGCDDPRDMRIGCPGAPTPSAMSGFGAPTMFTIYWCPTHTTSAVAGAGVDFLHWRAPAWPTALSRAAPSAAHDTPCWADTGRQCD